jgi:carboxyl-terminal processing protease
LDQVIEKILGPAGTQVTLTLRDPVTFQERDVTLTRARITMNAVTWRILPGTTVAHVRISGFIEGVSPGLQKALADVQAQAVTGIVLDLRNNPGGLLDGCIGVASQFLAGGNVLLQRDAQGHVQAAAVAMGVPKYSGPLVVLVNAGTASAAEIVAGAMQDARRAVIVGETTFGTGTVLNEFPLDDGSALLLATQEWLTPAGRTIWHEGIKPDVLMGLATGASPLFPDAEGSLQPGQLLASEDDQLLKALDLLGVRPHAPTRQVTAE